MSYKAKYRGVQLRSLLELSAIRHLEECGFVLGSTMLYESVRIPWGRAKRRQYIVDISIPERKLLIEVKPESRVGNRNNRAKRQAAEEWCEQNGWEYLIITDVILAKCGKVLSLEDAAAVPEVVLNERAVRTLRRRDRKKRKHPGRGARRRRQDDDISGAG